MAAGKELNGGVEVEESGRVDQWSCVSLDLGVVPLTFQKGIHLEHQMTRHTPAAAKITFLFQIPNPSPETEGNQLASALVPETCRRPSRSWYLQVEA